MVPSKVHEHMASASRCEAEAAELWYGGMLALCIYAVREWLGYAEIRGSMGHNTISRCGCGYQLMQLLQWMINICGANHPSFNKLHLQWHAHLSSWAWAHLRLSNGLLHGYSMWGWGWGVPLQITLCITTMVPPQGGGGNGCCRGFNYLPVIWTIIAYYREYKVQIIHMIITSILVR